jgi:hypothetical protein
MIEQPTPLPIQREIEELLAGQKKLLLALANQTLQLTSVQGQLDDILRVLIPPLPVRFGVTLETISNTTPTKFAVTERNT